MTDIPDTESIFDTADQPYRTYVIEAPRVLPTVDWYDTICWRVPRALLPLVAGHLAWFYQPEVWQETQYDDAAQTIARLLASLYDTGEQVFTEDTWYLALGDSLSVGKEAPGNEDGLPGYPFWVWNNLKTVYPGLKYQNEGISGETTDTMISDGQLQAALDFIAARNAAGERVGLITIDIGGNDIVAIFPPPIGVAANGTTQINNFRANFSYILTQLQAAAPTALIVVLNYYNPYPGFDFPLFGPLGDIWVPELNTAISDVAGTHNISVTDIYAVIQGSETHMRRHIYTRRPYEVWDIANAETNFDFHPRPQGHELMAMTTFQLIMRQVFERV